MLCCSKNVFIHKKTNFDILNLSTRATLTTAAVLLLKFRFFRVEMTCRSSRNYTLKTYRQRLRINFPQLIQFFRSSYKSLSWDLFLDGAIKLAGSEKGRKKAESEQGGIGGRGSTGAGLGLNAPLRFGVLMENCGRAGPTAATVAAREARDQRRPWREKK